MKYFINFSNWSKEEVKEWLKNNSKPKFNAPFWEIENFVNFIYNKYPQMVGIDFTDKEYYEYCGYCDIYWYKDNTGDYQEIKINNPNLKP